MCTIVSWIPIENSIGIRCIIIKRVHLACPCVVALTTRSIPFSQSIFTINAKDSACAWRGIFTIFGLIDKLYNGHNLDTCIRTSLLSYRSFSVISCSLIIVKKRIIFALSRYCWLKLLLYLSKWKGWGLFSV